MDLAANIRTRRLSLGWNLEMLAEQSGVSRAMLSDIERNLKNPTIKLVCQIAQSLGCTVSELLGEQNKDPQNVFQVLRNAQRPTLVDPHSSVVRQSLAPTLLKSGLEIVWYTLPIGQSTTDFPAHPTGVKEHLTLVEGRIRCRIGKEIDLELEVGDSLTFEANVEHKFDNIGNVPCAYFLVIDSTPRFSK